MNKKVEKRFLLVFIILLLAASAFSFVVSAKLGDQASQASSVGEKFADVGKGSSGSGIIKDITGPLLGNVDLTQFYIDNAPFIDFILFTILFVGLAQFALAKRFASEGSNAGKAIAVAVGLALSFGIVVAMKSAGLTIGSFGFIPLSLFFVIIAFAVYEIMIALSLPKYLSFAAVYLLVFYSLKMFEAKQMGVNAAGKVIMSEPPFIWLEKHAPVILGLLNLITAFCIVIIIYGTIMLFFKILKNTRSEYGGEPSGTMPALTQGIERGDRREIVEQERTQQIDREIDRLNNEERKLNGIETDAENAEIADLETLSQIMRELSITAGRINDFRRGG